MKQPRSFLAFLTICLGLLLLAGSACRSSGPQEGVDLIKQIQGRGYALVGVKFDAPPFGYLDADGAVKGYEIDLAKELVKKSLGNTIDIKFVQVNSSTRIAALDANQVDFVIATMTITPERAKKVDFSTSYYEAAQGMMVKQSSPIRTTQELADKTIAFVLGSTTQLHLKEEFPKAKLLGFKSATDAFGALGSGRADAFSTDDAILNGFLHAHCGLRVLPEKLSKEPYGIAFRRNEESQKLHDRIDTALAAIEKTDFLQQLDKKWHHTTPPSYCQNP